MYRREVRRRRAALVGLIVASLVLISAHFSEGDDGPLHAVQRGVATLISPLESLVTEALEPVRNMLSWPGETLDARGDRKRLEEELARARSELAEGQGEIRINQRLRQRLGLSPTEIVSSSGGYRAVEASVVARSPSVVTATVGLDVGSAEGVEVDDPVITADGLTGRIASVTATTSQVRLLNDPRNRVSATVLPDGPQGVVAAVAGDPDDLRLNFVANDELVEAGQMLVTAGWSNDETSSAYPYGLLIGEVKDAAPGDQGVERITVSPFVDMGAIDEVKVLTSKAAAG